MRIVQFSSSDGEGGAGLGALRLHLALRKAGHEAKLIVWRKLSADPDVIGMFGPDLRSKARYAFNLAGTRVLEHLLHPRGVFSFEGFGANFGRLRGAAAGADIVQLSWVDGLLDAPRLRAVAQASKAPIVWTLIDQAPLTGGCHFTWGCRRFTHQCGRCPALQSSCRIDLSHWAMRRKRRALRGLRVAIVAGSSCDSELAGASGLFSHAPRRVIPMPVDETVFRRRDMAIARDVLGVRSDKRVVFFGTASLTDERKGLRYLVQALRRLVDMEPVLAAELLLLVAGRQVPQELFAIGVEVQHLGFLGDERTLALAYQAADVYASPVVEDSGPMMVLESLMCGTPIVAFPIGYAADLLAQHALGVLAPRFDAEAFAAGLVRLLRLPAAETEVLRQRCAVMATSYCSSSAVAARYVQFYSELLDNRSR